jgi:hypothetical protein
MKRKILFTSMLFSIAALMIALNCNSYQCNNIGKLNELFSISSANAEGWNDPVWKEGHYDCSITLEGQAGATVKLFGVSYTIPTSGSLTLTFKNVATSCSSGGTSQCKYKTCADFFAGS